MKTLSLDFRERILAACDAGGLTQQQVADRFMVSLGVVKKLLGQRRRLGHVRPLHHRAGRRPKLTAENLDTLGCLVAEHPDWTLEQLRDALGVDCSLSRIHYALKKLGQSYKKSRSQPANKSARM